MYKMFNKSLICGIVIGLLCSGIVYAVSLYKAIDISYNKENWKVSNVNEALDNLKNNIDELNNYGDATAEEILEGKTALVKGERIVGTGKGSEVVLVANIGTVTANASTTPSYTYDIKNLTDNYSELTSSNFFITVGGAYGNTNYSSWSDASIYINKSYTASTGTLKITTTFSRANSGGYQASLYGVAIYMVS